VNGIQLVDGQIQFLNDSVRMLGAVEQDLRPIDRSSHLNHLRVITDESVTAARRGAVMPHGGAEGNCRLPFYLYPIFFFLFFRILIYSA
jgi:hypothetical protein